MSGRKLDRAGPSADGDVKEISDGSDRTIATQEEDKSMEEDRDLPRGQQNYKNDDFLEFVCGTRDRGTGDMID